jgi:hypothetical protein
MESTTFHTPPLLPMREACTMAPSQPLLPTQNLHCGPHPPSTYHSEDGD